MQSKICQLIHIFPSQHLVQLMKFRILILIFINRDQKIKMFGIVTTFVATRSGLTRFEDHRSEAEKLNSTGERPFFDTHTRQI